MQNKSNIRIYERRGLKKTDKMRGLLMEIAKEKLRTRYFRLKRKIRTWEKQKTQREVVVRVNEKSKGMKKEKIKDDLINNQNTEDYE